jgi:hypothetical protein
MDFNNNRRANANRSIVFLYFTATVVGSQLIASPLVYLLTNVNLWLSMFCGLGCLWLASIVAAFIPRALARNRRQHHSRTKQPNDNQAPVHTIREQLMGLIKAAMWFSQGNTLVTTLILTFLVTTLGRSAQDILLQYITKRYGWLWSQVSTFLYHL